MFYDSSQVYHLRFFKLYKKSDLSDREKVVYLNQNLKSFFLNICA